MALRKYELPGGQKSPILFQNENMIDKELLKQHIAGHISETGIFLVDVKLSSTGRITVLIDRHEGVTIEDCISLSRWISGKLGEEAGDYELNVSSPGLDMPFLVIEQYRKNEGRLVEVEDHEGVRQKGLLDCVTDGGFELLVEKKQKGKAPETVVSHYNYDEVNSVKVVISFK
jgi:ribosome maturation factor RimP